MKTRSHRARTAFTLIEMLIVVVIISILAALLIPTILGVLAKTKGARIVLETKQLESAFEAYKQKYGDYPPDFSSRPLVERHIAKCFPRAEDYDDIVSVLWVDNTSTSNAGYWVPRVDPAEAVVLFLGGLSSDPKAPFTGPGGPLKVLSNGTIVANNDRESPLFEFQEERLTLYSADPANKQPSLAATSEFFSDDEQTLHGQGVTENDPFPVYYIIGLQTPYTYFDSRTYGGDVATSVSPSRALPPPVYPPDVYASTSKILGKARPYMLAVPRRPLEWASDESLQIITPGLDEDFGADVLDPSSGSPLPKVFPTGTNYTPEDLDNITNFSEGELEDRIP